jgi:hypothetical protein
MNCPLCESAELKTIVRKPNTYFICENCEMTESDIDDDAAFGLCGNCNDFVYLVKGPSKCSECDKLLCLCCEVHDKHDCKNHILNNCNKCGKSMCVSWHGAFCPKCDGH